jgi:hypothetical protein
MSIEKLSNLLSDEEMTETKSEFPDENQFRMLRKKGVYCYDYFDSFEKFKETKLPSKDCFFNRLKNEHISNEDFDFAHNVFTSFNCKNLEEYTLVYLKSDVLLLADIFLNFRRMIHSNYGLDVCHYYSIASLSFDAMLKFSKVKIDKISESDIQNFATKSVRGGICVVNRKIVEANNHYMKNFDSNLPESYLMYLDFNSLYSKTMLYKLPVSNFRFLEKEEIQNFDLDEVDLEGDYGFILEVDIVYPNSVRIGHNELPFFPVKQKIANSNEEKLLLTLEDKDHYIVHARNLKHGIDNGLKIKNIHKILTFKQSDFMKGYIEFTIGKREESKTPFHINAFKLMANSVYGKFLESSINQKGLQTNDRLV